MSNVIRQNTTGDDGVAANSGDAMEANLSDEDGRAVDMLLDRDGPSNNGGETSAAPAHNGTFHKRLARVETILRLLSAMPAAEPPAYLAQRVMQRVEESPRHLGAAAPTSSDASTIDARGRHA